MPPKRIAKSTGLPDRRGSNVEVARAKLSDMLALSRVVMNKKKDKKEQKTLEEAKIEVPCPSVSLVSLDLRSDLRSTPLVSVPAERTNSVRSATPELVEREKVVSRPLTPNSDNDLEEDIIDYDDSFTIKQTTTKPQKYEKKSNDKMKNKISKYKTNFKSKYKKLKDQSKADRTSFESNLQSLKADQKLSQPHSSYQDIQKNLAQQMLSKCRF